MSSQPLCTRADLELRHGAANVIRFSDDTGEGLTSAAENVIDEAIGQASDEAYAILRMGYPSEEQARLLVGSDRAAKGAVCSIAIAILAMRRIEFLGPEGETLYAAQAREARSLLRSMAKAELASVGETAAGANTTTGLHTNRPASVLIFQADSRNPRGKGSF